LLSAEATSVARNRTDDRNARDVFGIGATLLATVGLYGVMAFTVSRKTREISIRIALGALTKDVIWMVMREVLLLIGIGVVIGMGGALLLTRYIEGQLSGLRRTIR
jgi:ABC-type antimicrobial peptide transport system permease subunit